MVDKLNRQRRFDGVARMLATSGVPPRLLRVRKAWGASVKEMGQDADRAVRGANHFWRGETWYHLGERP